MAEKRKKKEMKQNVRTCGTVKESLRDSLFRDYLVIPLSLLFAHNRNRDTRHSCLLNALHHDRIIKYVYNSLRF